MRISGVAFDRLEDIPALKKDTVVRRDVWRHTGDHGFDGAPAGGDTGQCGQYRIGHPGYRYASDKESISRI